MSRRRAWQWAAVYAVVVATFLILFALRMADESWWGIADGVLALYYAWEAGGSIASAVGER